MGPRTSFRWLALCLFSGHAVAKVQLERPTDQCSLHSTVGTETCCCNGDCGSGPVPSGEWIAGMGCREYETPSVCTNTQVYRTDNNTLVDNGGQCYSICNWQRWEYTYKCCDCPPGFITTADVTPNCGSIVDICVGCTEPWETPVKTGTSLNSWECRRRGLNCDVVDTISRGLDAASREGGSAATYYGQLLDQACLRSNCSSVSSCQRVANFQSNNSECRNLDGDFEFEQTVLEKTAKASDDTSVAKAGKEADNAATALSVAFAASSIALGSENPLLSLFIVASGGTDPSIWGETYAGISHFSVGLAPQIQGFIRDIVKSNNNTEQLQSKLIRFGDAQDRMLRCAVIPNLQIQASKNELLPNPSLAGSLLAPLGATTLRMAATQVELDRAKRFESFKKSLAPLGITLPRDNNLIWNPRNWADTPTLPGLATTLTELSPSTEANPLIKVSLAAAAAAAQAQSGGYSLTLQIQDRDAKATALMARASLLDPTSNPSLPVPMLWKINNHNLQLVSPIAAIYPALADLAMWNATHVLAGNISAEPILFGDYLTKGQSTTNVDKDSYIMYRKATVKLAVAKDLLDRYPVGDLAMYDLVSGMKMDAKFEQRTDQEGGGGEFHTDVSLGKGGYEGQWGGGGCFGIGLTSERSEGTRRGVAGGNLVGIVGLAMGIVAGWV
ncbi:hypothetical protein B0T16DRAFT_214610 [Cercophora newfieldiana]|uniref:Uncharacterized protein n=1 Tax=Cercophora newfieldiana TaxID=92897 RepID=A0AA39XWK3_9PEZI|nr:hypothetical protein B0T16DRAFT_214610 [Cercophora newfieldiana]